MSREGFEDGRFFTKRLHEANMMLGISMNVNTPCILQVEDDENDVLLLELVFKKAGLECPLRVVEDGQKAIDYLSGAESMPTGRSSLCLAWSCWT